METKFTLTDGSKVEVKEGKIEIVQPVKVEDQKILEHKKSICLAQIAQGEKAKDVMKIIDEKLALIRGKS